LGVEPKRMSESAMRFLSSLELPGNVRQLENLCNWITVMAPGQTVEVKDLPRDLTQAPPSGAAPFTPALAEGGAVAPAVLAPPPPSPEGWIGLLELQAASMLSAGQFEVMDTLGKQFESALIKTALKHTHGRKNDAAMRLGIGRNTITRKIVELGIDGAREE
jgi:two-component system nitrogen regulation response regulator GlnG